MMRWGIRMAIGALYDTHHGLTNAVFMPYVLAFNRPAIEDRITRLAAYLGLEASFDAFQQYVLAIRRDVGIPHALDGLKVGVEKETLIAEMAIVDPTAGGNPVPLDIAGARRIFQAALSGKVG